MKSKEKEEEDDKKVLTIPKKVLYSTCCTDSASYNFKSVKT
jgi:hypothetical protein